MSDEALDMHNDPLREKTEAGKTAIGLYINDPNMVELAAHLGFDWFMLDQMFTSHGWEKTEELIRTAESVGITPVIRVQSYPWFGYDSRIPVDVSRNLGIGARYVMISNSGVEEIEKAAHLAHDYHRKVSHVYPFDEFLPYGDSKSVTADEEDEDIQLEASIIPQPETKESLESLEETISIPEVEYCFLAMGDASQELTGSERPNFDDPIIWDFIDEAVELGKKHNTVIGANPSFARSGEDFTYSLDVIEDRVVKLHEHGIRMIMAQGAPLYFQLAGGELLQNVSNRIEQ